MNVAPEHENEFNEWYNVEHLPALGAVPGVLAARRYRGSGAAQRYAAIYHFANAGRAQLGGLEEPPRTRRGPSACGRISATSSARLPPVCGAIAKRNLSQRRYGHAKVRE